ncbi:MAG: hypothetical protein R6W86_07960 [Marinobacter sp.]
MSEAQEFESFRLPQAPLPTLCRRKAAKPNQPGFIRVQFQTELCQSASKGFRECVRIILLLESQHRVVSVADDHHVAMRSLLSTGISP